MAILNVKPEQAIIDGFKGKVDFYEWNGLPVARKWPRSPGHDRSPAVQATWPIFTAAVHAWPTLSPEIQQSYRDLAAGTTLSGRDLFIKGYIHGIYRYKKRDEMLPSCYAYLAGPMLNLVSGTWYKVLYDAEIYDIGGNFDTVNNEFVAPRDGRYLIISNILFTTMVAAGQRWHRFMQNGVEIVATREDNVGAAWQVLQLSAVLSLAAADKITIEVMQSSGVNTVDLGSFSNWTNLFVSLLE